MKIEKPENYKYYTFAKDGRKELYLYAENKLLMTKGTGFIRVPFSDIENKWDLNVQINAMRYLNMLLDEKIVELVK